MPLAALSRLVASVLILLSLQSCFFYETTSISGGNLFRRERCIDCHGPDGLGTGNGPSLDSMASYWTTEALTDYLVDPELVLPSNPRLSRIADAHDARMAPFGHLSERERRALAVFVLKIQR